MKKIKILITGANGFIGGHLTASLETCADYQVVAGVSARTQKYYPQAILLDENFTLEQWQACLQGVDVIIHCAARAHKTKEKQEKLRALYQKINVDMTANMAKAAAIVGVKKLIFMSTVGVNGAVSDQPFTEVDAPCPHNVYAESKLAAENVLLEIAKDTILNVCILRLPLVYGPGVQANFLSLIKIIDKNCPLPFGAITHQRSLLGVENLCGLVACVLKNETARNQVFLAADIDIAVPQLIRDIAYGLHKKNRLFSLPLPMLQFLLRLVGKGRLYTQLCEPLLIDTSKACKVLGWTPSVPYQKGLENTLKHYIAEAHDE